MEQKPSRVWSKFIVKIMVTTLIIMLVSGGICFYQKNVSMMHFSEILTIVALLYAALCGFIAYSGYNNTKDVSYQYQRTVQSSGYEDRRKVDLKYLDANLNLAVVGICSGILCFIIAFIVGSAMM